MSTETLTYDCPRCHTPTARPVAGELSRRLAKLQMCDGCIAALEQLDREREQRSRAQAYEIRVRQSGLPKSLRGLTWDEMRQELGRAEVIAAVRSWVVKGGSLFLFSRPGPGKTRLAATACAALLHSRPARFVQASVLLTKANSDFGSDWRRQAQEILLGGRPLILDDLGKEAPTDLARQLLQAAIDDRINEGVHLLITSNLTAPQLGAVYGDWLASRLGQMDQWEMPGPDMRLEL